MIRKDSQVMFSLIAALAVIFFASILIRNRFWLVSTSSQSTKVITDQQSTSGNPATRCTTDSDCVIKISIDCCDGYARCFNKDYEPDSEQFKKACREGMPPYICEHKEVEDCKCQNAECINIYE